MLGLREHLSVAVGPWSEDEIQTTVDVYFRMLTLELADEAYVKAEFQREAARTVDRSIGAISKKFSNVSAALDEINALWIPGYKPLTNMQDRLRVVVRERFAADTDLRSFMLRAAEDTEFVPSSLGAEVDPPAADWPERVGERVGVVDINFAAIESSNHALGRAGEETVLNAERERLSIGGRSDLSPEVRHVSVVDGDGLGYDIQSFHGLTDEPVFIEVKTTRYGKEVPFYISGNEVEASNDLGPAYRLWRLFRYGKADTGYYRLPGPLSSARTAEARHLPRPALSRIGLNSEPRPKLRRRLRRDPRAPRSETRSIRRPVVAQWCQHLARHFAPASRTSTTRSTARSCGVPGTRANSSHL